MWNQTACWRLSAMSFLLNVREMKHKRLKRDGFLEQWVHLSVCTASCVLNFKLFVFVVSCSKFFLFLLFQFLLTFWFDTPHKVQVYIYWSLLLCKR